MIEVSKDITCNEVITDTRKDHIVIGEGPGFGKKSPVKIGMGGGGGGNRKGGRR